jgi:ribonuclease HI
VTDRADAPWPAESLSPLAERIDRALAARGYDLPATVAAVDDATPGPGGLFDPRTDPADLRTGIERVLDDGPVAPAEEPTPLSSAVLYTDGSSRGNPGPAGAGAVIVGPDGAERARLGRPVGSNAGNNRAEYAALLLGLDGLARRFDPAAVEVRIDSMTVVRDVWRGHDAADHRAYAREIEPRLAALPVGEPTHLADHEPNPADALATVGADVAALGP